ncbi:hypothetical protein LEN26_011418 [Aphanomyces euteiches]|nr:hypothetical protein AeMF1_020676 [Aphanomyces euteiches]KAH9119838.1 hypothetical protein LEN26_011418 [Aphanomyces euteiches]KAH9186924.1 hypothetical protein AeNC1_011106 [Aphanomyces euteiches]
MEIVKDKIDDAFENYALTFEGKTSAELLLRSPLFPQLEAPAAASKEVWNARVFHNGLMSSPFHENAVFYLNRDGDLMQVQQSPGEIQVTKLLSFPDLATTPWEKRFDNPSLRFVAGHMGILADGTGKLILFGYLQGEWCVLWESSPFGSTPTSLYLLQAQLTSEELVHCLVGSLDSRAGSHRVYAVTIDLQAPQNAAPLLVYEGGKAVRYAHFQSPHDIVFLVEDKHELKVPIQAEASAKKVDEMEETPRILKPPRAGLGFSGEIPNPELPLPQLNLEDLNEKSLYDRFLASSTPYSSMEQSVRTDGTIKPPSAPAIPLEAPTTESMLGGFEECDDIDPNATAVLYAFDFANHVCTASFQIICRRFHFLGPSSVYSDRLLFQYDVHGLVFGLRWHPHHLSLEHEATFLAFGYVQASKTQKKYLLFHPSGSLAILADFEKRLYLYKGRPEAHQKPHMRSSLLHELSADEQIYGIQFTSPSSLAVLTNSRVIALSVTL